MISKEEARSIAQERIDQRNAENAVLISRLDIELPMSTLFDDPIAEGDYGWLFAYQSEDFFKSGNPADMLAGNAPLLIDRQTGAIFECGTAAPIEIYISNFVNFGHPHKWGGKKLQLLGFEKGANKAAASRAIRKFTDCGLADAKQNLDLCLDGVTTLIECQTPEQAAELATELRQLNFNAKQLPEEGRQNDANPD